MKYDLNNCSSYEHLMGSENKAHMGSQSHLGNNGPPSHYHSVGAGSLVSSGGANEHDPGGATPGKIGKGSANKLPPADE